MMARRLLIILIGVLFPVTGWAAQEYRAVVLPFAVYSQEDLSYLKAGIPQLLGQRLRDEGIAVVPAPAQVPATVTEEDARKLREEAGADFAFYGSISKVGDSVSIDAVLVSADEHQAPVSFFETGMGLENLPKILDKVVAEVAKVVFKRVTVSAVEVTGNKRIETSAILAVATTKVGDVFSLKSLDRDLREIFKLGYFENVSINVEDVPGGKKVEFQVVEKPSVSTVQVKGNKELKTDEILEAVNIKPYSVLNLDKIREGVEAVKDLYRKKGFLNIDVKYNLEPEEKERTVSVVLDVDEGAKAYITKIRFTGNHAFSDKKLAEQMETSTKGLLWWIFDSGKLDMQKLRQDTDRLSSFYFNSGYIRARVGEPDVQVEGERITITIPVEEGPRYNVGKVDIEGDFVKPKDELTASLKIKKGEVYNRDLVRQDILNLRDAYADFGYAFAEIDPMVNINDKDRLVDIAYKANKGKKVYFERINIVGNTATRDKVIRRELRVEEQGLYSARNLRRSSERLHRLDYFENIDMATSPGTEDDKLDLRVEVTEKKTGTFSIGAGYSTLDGPIGMFDISQRNFLGRGERLSLTGQIGGRNQRFSLSFNEPWMFDIPLSNTYEIYNWIRTFPDYGKDAYGGTVRFAYPIWRESLYASIKYRFESAKVSDVADDAAKIIQDQEGRATTSSVMGGFKWDTTDNFFLPTKGTEHSISVEHAGTPFGGSNTFTRYMLSTGWWFPVRWGWVGHLEGKMGYVTEDKKGGLPLYEKFYLGGINSLRGFERYSVSPRDAATGDRIGGTRMWIGTAEVRFPVMSKAGLYGVMFYDTGNSYAESDTWDVKNLRSSVGLGVRWMSPMGPLRLEWGVNIDPEPDESKSVFDFALGGTFD